jgi:hypothetical protein
MDVNKKVSQHDEMISEMLKTLDRINDDLQKAGRRADYTIRRLVKLETLDSQREIVNSDRKRLIDQYQAEMVNLDVRIAALEKWISGHDERHKDFDKHASALERCMMDQQNMSAKNAKTLKTFEKALNRLTTEQTKQRKLLLEHIETSTRRRK